MSPPLVKSMVLIHQVSRHAMAVVWLSFHIVLLNGSIYGWLFQLVKTFNCHCVYSVIAGLLSIHLDRCNGWPSGKWIGRLSVGTEWERCTSVLRAKLLSVLMPEVSRDAVFPRWLFNVYYLHPANFTRRWFIMILGYCCVTYNILVHALLSLVIAHGNSE